MPPERLAQMMTLLKENLVQAGTVSYVIEEAPLKALAVFIDENRLALRPPQVAIAYSAIQWCMKQERTLLNDR
jgi:hypothetical protein